MTDLKQWKDGKGHILGFIRWNGDKVPQLMILRKALDMAVDKPDDVDLIGPLVGNMPVRCSICGETKWWRVSVDALVALFADLDDRDVLEFSQRLLRRSNG